MQLGGKDIPCRTNPKRDSLGKAGRAVEPHFHRDVQGQIIQEDPMHSRHTLLRPLTAAFGLLLVGAVGLIACSEPPAPPAVEPASESTPLVSADGVSRTGLYVYYADSARFTDCATGESLPVTANAGGHELERSYLSARREPLQPLLVEVIGRVETLPGMEEGTILPHLVVDQLIRVTDDSRCPGADIPFTDTQWQLRQLGEQAVTFGTGLRAPHLVFDDRGAVYGHTGCNTLRGSYQRDDSRLTLSGIAVTKMACLQGADHEAAFLAMLSQVSTAGQEGQQLHLTGADGTTLAVFEPVFHD
jgi:heat shock protein HslJ